MNRTDRPGEARDGSAEFDAAVANVVFGRGDEGLFLAFGLHVGADGALDALNKVGLLRLGQPGFNLGGVALLLFLVLHLAEEELPLQLFTRQVLDVFDQIRFRLHEGVQLGVDFGVDFELLGQFGLFFRGCDCHG